MDGLLDSIIDNHGPSKVVSEQNDASKINWQNAMDDFAEMKGIRKGRDMVAGANRRAALDTSNNRVNMFVAGKPAWHELGTVIDRACESEQALQISGQNFDVEKVPLGYQFNEQWKAASGAYSLVRMDTGAHLNVVGDAYRVIQNRVSFKLVDNILKEFGARYESAGCLYGGQKVWILAHLPKQAFSINGADKISPYLVFMNFHGKGAGLCFPTVERIVCGNTFSIAKRKLSGKRHSVKHTGNIDAKMKSLEADVRASVLGIEAYKEAANVLYHKPLDFTPYANDVLDTVLDVTQAQMSVSTDTLVSMLNIAEAEREAAFKRVDRQKEDRKEILEEMIMRYESDRNAGMGTLRGTAWAGVNAVTEYADHHKRSYKGDNHTQQSRRFEDTLLGPSQVLKETAMSMALAR